MIPFEDEPFQLDCYVEGLLSAATVPSTAAGPAAPSRADADLDPELAHAAGVLSRLVRFHPSFRFEEDLAARLAVAADAMAGARPPAAILPFPRPFSRAPIPWREPGRWNSTGPLGLPALPAVPARAATSSSPARGRFRLAAAPFALPAISVPLTAEPVVGRASALATALGVDRVPGPLLLGGAIASGVSLAGAAVVGWHMAHRGRRPS